LPKVPIKKAIAAKSVAESAGHFTELAGLADSFVQPSIASFVVVPSVLRIVVADLPLLNPVLGFLNLRHGHLFS
jgi:hypothetical protein